MNSVLPNRQAGSSNSGGLGRRIRVLVVDDSALLRKLVTQAIESDPALEVVGYAPNGVVALQRIAQLDPDVVTLDIEMPEMDGIETLRRVRASYPALRVIMCSTLTERGAAITIEALMLGANDYVHKGSPERMQSAGNPGPGQSGGHAEASVHALQADLVPKLKQFFLNPKTTAGLAGGGHAAAVQPGTRPAPVAWPPKTPGVPAGPIPGAGIKASAVVPEALVIGVSTGGPTALHEILPQIPAYLPIPVLIVQHMPPLFTRLLAERLATRVHLKVEEARDGQPVEAGTIYIAPGDYHMRVAGQPGRVRVALDQGPPENSCRPAVDVLFRSAGEVWGPSVAAVVLTGMGSDGLLGCEKLRAKSAYVIAQDEASSVVWGMPGFVARAGLADRVLPLMDIIPDIVDRCQPAIRGGLRSGVPASAAPPRPAAVKSSLLR